jgi:hypothetical protein
MSLAVNHPKSATSCAHRLYEATPTRPSRPDANAPGDVEVAAALLPGAAAERQPPEFGPYRIGQCVEAQRNCRRITVTEWTGRGGIDVVGESSAWTLDM